MQIRDPAIASTERNETEIVTLSVMWDGLTAQEGDQLEVWEPVNGGFTVDRMVRIIVPDGYELTTVTPSATERTPTAATWDAGTEFEGFEVTFASAEAETTTVGDGTGVGAPRFGVGVALLAVVVSIALLMYCY